MEELYKRIDKALKKRGYESKGKTNQSAFLKAFNDKYPYHQISQPQLSTILNGKGNLTLDRLVEIAQLLNVSADYLLGISDRLEYEEIQTISDYLGLSEEAINTLHDYYNCKISNPLESSNIPNPLETVLSSPLGREYLKNEKEIILKEFTIETPIYQNQKIALNLKDYKRLKLSILDDTLSDIYGFTNNTYQKSLDYYMMEIESAKKQREEGEQNAINKKKE